MNILRQQVEELIVEVVALFNYFVDNNPCNREESAEWRIKIKTNLDLFHRKHSLSSDRELSFDEVSVATLELLTIMNDTMAYHTSMIDKIVSELSDS